MANKLTISLIIVVWILLQIFTGFFVESRRTWPFVAYPMYAGKHNIGDKVTELRLYGHTVSGKFIEVSSQEFGLQYWGFRWQGWSKLLDPKTRKFYASRLFSLYNQKHKGTPQELKELQVTLESIMVTRNGPSDLIREIVFTYNPRNNTISSP